MSLPQPADFELTLAEICLRSTQEHPDRPFLKWRQSTLTVKEVIDLSSIIASNLSHTGAVKNTKIGVMLDNHPNHIATLLALGILGVIWIPLDRRLKPAHVKNVLNLADVDLVIAEPEYRDTISQANPECSILHLNELIVPATDKITISARNEINPSDTRALMFTSGTTGDAKAVIVTERMFTGAAHFCTYASQADSSANYYLWEPLNHIGGAQIIPMALLSGATVSVTERFSASRFWSEVVACGANRIHYLGGILELLLASDPSPLEREHQVTLGFGAGASATVSAKFTQRFGIPLREVYGMTEAASFTTININGPAGSMGKPLEYFCLSLRDQNDNEVATGEIGEIALSDRSIPLLTPGYYQNTTATKAAFHGDRFYTGDLARQDDNGYLYFCGRLKDRIRCKGENVIASDIEAVYNAHPRVAESAVVGYGEPNTEQELVVFIQLTRNEFIKNEHEVLQAIVNWTDSQLMSFQQPRFVMVVREFSRTPSERIQKHKLPADELVARAWDRNAANS